MKNIVLSLILLVIFAACSRKIFKTTYYYQKANSKEFFAKSKRYVVRIPINGTKSKIEGSHEKEFIYSYNDSSIFYVGDFEPAGTTNALNIKLSPSYSDYVLSKDSISRISGNVNGKYWKEFKIKDRIVVGYKDVPEDKLPLFEKCLNSIKEFL